MRVLHVDSGKTMRGGQWQVLALLERLEGSHMLMAAANGSLLSLAANRGIETCALSPLGLLGRSRQFDLVHVHDARSHTWAAAAARAPLVVARRVAFPVGRSVLSRWKYRQADLFIAVSEFVKRRLMEAGVSDERIVVVPDGVRIPEAHSSGSRVLALATHDPMKGYDLVQEAARISGLSVQYSDDLESELPSAAVFVYVTRSEGLGSAALLAMAHGVPVVASRVGGLPEIVEDGVTGVLTDNDPKAIAAAIGAVLSRRNELGCQARRHVAERFTIDQMVERTRRAYDRVLAC